MSVAAATELKTNGVGSTRRIYTAKVGLRFEAAEVVNTEAITEVVSGAPLVQPMRRDEAGARSSASPRIQLCPPLPVQERCFSARPGAPRPTAEVSEVATELEKLSRLHQVGALTDDEFAAAKANMLG